MDPGPTIDVDEFNEWYNKEHVPERLGIPGVLSGARYDSHRGTPRYIALYELSSIDVLSSEEYLSVRRAVTPWTRRIGRNLEHNLRYEYELIGAAGDPPTRPPSRVVLARYDMNEGAPSPPEADALASLDGVTRVRHYRTP